MQDSVLWYVSYSRNDAEKSTLGLVRILRASGKYKVWIDTKLEPGTEVGRRISQRQSINAHFPYPF